MVEVWEHYNVSLELDSTSTRVKEELTIKNVIDKPVVPGYGFITLSREKSLSLPGLSFSRGGSEKGPEISEVSAELEDGSRITDIRVSEEGNSTTIRYGFWTPVMPGESRTITIEYSTDGLVEKGLFFDRVSYSIQPSSIPIKNARITAYPGEGRYVSYSSEIPDRAGDAVSWTRSGLETGSWNLDFECGSLPLPRAPMEWGNIGWGLAFGIICLWSYRQWRD